MNIKEINKIIYSTDNFTLSTSIEYKCNLLRNLIDYIKETNTDDIITAMSIITNSILVQDLIQTNESRKIYLIKINGDEKSKVLPNVFDNKDNAIDFLIKQYGVIFVDEKDVSGKGIRDSEKILSNLMSDVDAQLLSSVVILGQGLPQKFTNNTPSGRKEVLEKLTHSDFMIDDLKKRVTQRQNMLSEQISDTSTKLNGERSKREVLARQRAEAESFLSKSVDDVKEKVDGYRTELTKLEEDVRLIEATKAEISAQISELLSY